MKLVVVDRVAAVGGRGGAVFCATCQDGAKHRFVADHDVMPRPPQVGEVWAVTGSLRRHPVYGLQVVATRATLQRPSGRLFVALIARSRAFPGIGERLADKLWRRFGEALYAMLEAGDPAPFELPLGSRVLARTLVEGWRDLAHLCDAFLWLERHGVPVALAQRLAEVYRQELALKLEENPYRLQAFSNWETADRLARSVGIGHEDDRRLVAAADAAVMKILRRRDTWMSEGALREAIRGIAAVSEPQAERAVQLALAEHAVLRVADGLQGLGPATMERFVAETVMAIAEGRFAAMQPTLRRPVDKEFLVAFFDDFHRRESLTLTSTQQFAVETALISRAAIICGGAGVGKTTVLKAFCAATERIGASYFLLALSGRAARRMADATGREALTIAAFLVKVRRGKIRLVAEPVIVVDEASMLDLPTTYRLLRALEPGCRLLLLGDPGQLPPISFGLVFHVLVESRLLPLVELTEVHRQAAATGIPQASLSVRNGRVPRLGAFTGNGCGVQFIGCRREEISERLPALLRQLGGVGEVQILSPVKNGPAGTREINRLFHSLRLKAAPGGSDGFLEDEPVIWTENDYQLGLMNGSLGRVVKSEGSLKVAWDGVGVTGINPARMDHAYAITVHKSQGSQFRRVVVPVFTCQLLDRTMLYTAVTRAQEQVVLIGDLEAFNRAVASPPSTSLRRTGFGAALESVRMGPRPSAEDALSNKGTGAGNISYLPGGRNDKGRG